MMLYLNYEEALLLQNGGEPLATLVAIRLSQEMISEEGRALGWLQPRWPFDMRYFYGSVCRTVASHIGYRLRMPLPAPPRLTCGEVPDLSVAPWPTYDFVTMGLGRAYIELVQSDSMSDCPRFDAVFALHIAGRALDQQFIGSLPAWIENLEKNPPGNTFDEWLAGFSPETDAEPRSLDS